MKTQKFGILTIALALVVAISTSSASAAVIYSNGGPSITMTELLDGGSIEVDGVLFSGFHDYSIGGNGFTSDTDFINVFGTGMGTGEVGLDYQNFGVEAAAGQQQNVHFEYFVDATATGGISMMHLSSSTLGATEPDGSITIKEGVLFAQTAKVFEYEATDQLLKQSWVIFDSPNAGPFEVTKDIQLVGNLGTAAMSDMQQTYTVIPEPASFGLLGLGALGLIRRRRMA